MSWTFDNGTILTRAALLGEYGNNAFVVACSHTGRGVIIDAAAEPDRILELADGVEVEALLTTHGHHDHLRAVAPVVEALGLPFLLHPADYELAARTTPVAPTRAGRTGGDPLGGDEPPDHAYTGSHAGFGVLLSVPECSSPGTRCFRVVPAPPSSKAATSTTIIKSIKQRLFTLDDDYRGVSGAWPEQATTIGTENAGDLPEWIARGW